MHAGIGGVCPNVTVRVRVGDNVAKGPVADDLDHDALIVSQHGSHHHRRRHGTADRSRRRRIQTVAPACVFHDVSCSSRQATQRPGGRGRPRQ